MEKQYRTSMYWGVGDAGRALYEPAVYYAENDLRFKGSLMEFQRYAVRFTLEHDRSLPKIPKHAAAR